MIVSLIQKAEKEINVTVTVYTLKRTKLSKTDVDNFNMQYPTLDVKYTNIFHDRFLILDRKTAYHIGASLKDAGKNSRMDVFGDKGIL